MPGLKGKYDAWNRLVEVRDSNDNLIAQYEYNGLNQRIKKTVNNVETKLFFNENWQEIESATNNQVTNYVWGLRYIDDLILREKGEERLYSLADPNWNIVAICDTTGDIQERYNYNAFGKRNIFDEDFTAKSGSEVTSYVWGLRYIDDLVLREKGEERLYSLADPNWNVIAICDSVGNIQERYTYDAFGKQNIFDADFITKAGTTFNWNRAFTGQVLDSETGLMLYRERFYLTRLGCFVSRDPIGYSTGDFSLYRYVYNKSILLQDPHGLMPPMGCCNGKKYNPSVQGCCKGSVYSKKNQCCEFGTVVSKVSIWFCERPLNNCMGPYLYTFLPIGNQCNILAPQKPRHSYICCNGANIDCYGMQQKQTDGSYTKAGNPVPKESLAIGTCTEYKVCPIIKQSKCDNPIAPYDYNWYYSNCNVWAVDGLYCNFVD
jgi:RHS repeat-associated protein